GGNRVPRPPRGRAGGGWLVAGGRLGVTTAGARRGGAPGAGGPVTELMSEECGWGLPKDAAEVPPGVSAGSTGWSVRVVMPTAGAALAGLVGKHGSAVLLAQQNWEMPPLASTQLPAASWLTQAVPVHPALQAAPLQLSSWVWGPAVSGHGFEPVSSFAVPVVSGSSMSSEVGGEAPSGTHALDSR